MFLQQGLRDPAARRGLIGGMLAAVALAWGLGACGGGGGEASTATPASSTSSAYTQGTLTGFGSIIVNGVHFDETSATITDDAGTLQAASALKLGMQVQIDSAAVANGAATAHAVRFGSIALGPVASIDTGTSTFVLLGQTIDVGTDTVFDRALAAGLSALTVDAVVAVHGVYDSATGHIVASRIDSASSASAYKLRGTVASLDTTAKTFAIGGAVIDYSGIAASEVPATLADGVTMRALLSTTPNASGQWVATRLGDGSAPRPAEHAQALVRGTISAFTSSASFSVNGLTVDASSASFPDGTSALALGVAVEVAGTVSNGVLVATVVRLESAHGGDGSHTPQVHGTISSIDSAAQTFVVRGVTVSYAGAVTYVDGSASDLAVGRSVTVVGTIGATTSTSVSASSAGSVPDRGGRGRDCSVIQATTITFD